MQKRETEKISTSRTVAFVFTRSLPFRLFSSRLALIHFISNAADLCYKAILDSFARYAELTQTWTPALLWKQMRYSLVKCDQSLFFLRHNAVRLCKCFDKKGSKTPNHQRKNHRHHLQQHRRLRNRRVPPLQVKVIESKAVIRQIFDVSPVAGTSTAAT